MLKRYCLFLLLILFGGLACAAGQNATMLQVSTYGALSQGVYNGDYSYMQLAQQGDFGLGTFNGLGGEMIAVNGYYYHGDVKGDAELVNPAMYAPFADVVHFQPTIHFKIDKSANYEDLQKAMLKYMPNKNIPYAIEVQGTFESTKLRGLKSYKPPYPNFSKVEQEQNEFTLKGTSGIAFGFWFPSYFSGVAPNGFHFHYINEQRKKAGHVLSLQPKQVEVSMEPIRYFDLYLPNTKTFSKADLTPAN